MTPQESPETQQIKHLLEGIQQQYGYDFKNYAPDSVRRRLRHRLALYGLNSISELETRVMQDHSAADTLLQDLSINVTEMFRDPPLYPVLKAQVLPILAEHAHIKIWHAGCATGEEVYSMAILLSEAGLYPRTRLYATDFNNVVLKQAQSGRFKIDQMRHYVRNYHAAGGRRAFVDYYHTQYNTVVMNADLRQQMVFAHHNLTTDQVFGEMQMVVCRNVLIYFNRQLQETVIQLFYDSLEAGGILCLGSAETLQLSRLAAHFEVLDYDLRLYRKIK